MAATYEIATAYVSLVPSFRGAGRHIQTGLASNENRRAAGAAGATLGTSAAAGAGQAIGSSRGASQISSGLSRASGAVNRAASSVGSGAAASMAASMRASIRGNVRAASFASGIRSAMEGAALPAAASAGTSGGRGFVSRMGDAVRRGASSVAGAMAGIGAASTASASTAGRAAGTGFVSSFTRSLGPLAAAFSVFSFANAGWQRAAGLEEAEATLRNLGYTAEETAATMDAAWQSTLGTSFRFDDAAKASVGLLAAGIEGAELEQTLKSIADVATIAGVDMGEMGSIFNQVAANGTLQAEELNRLTDRGVPALQELAKSLGVTVPEVREMMRQGEISFRDFRDAMIEGFGGVSAASGETMRGLFRNIGAAISDFSAAIWEGLFPALRSAGEAFEEFLRVTAIPAAQNFIQWLRDNRQLLGPVTVGFLGMAGALGVIAVALKGYSVALTVAAAAQRLFTRTNVIILAISLVVGLIAALVNAYQTNEEFRDRVQSVFAAVGGFISDMWQRVKPIFDMFVGWFNTTRDVVDGTVVPVFSRVADVAGNVLGAALGFLTDTVFPALVSAVQAVGRFFGRVWNGILAVVAPVVDAIQWAINRIIVPAFQTFMRVVGPILRWFYNVVKNVVILAIDLFAFAARWLWNNVLSRIFPRIRKGWDALGKLFRAAYRSLIKPTIDAFARVAQWLWRNVLQPVWRSIQERWRQLSIAFRAAWNGVIKPAVDAFGRAARALYNTFIKPAVDRIRSVWRGLSESFRNVWRNNIKPVLDAFGRFVRHTLPDMIRRGVDALGRAWRSIANKFRSPINWVINTVWNDGLKRGFDGIARAVNSDARLPSIPTIPAFAEGGRHSGGWALVGEEGPELVNFSNPGRVYTAAETQEMLSRGQDLPPDLARRAAGNDPSEAVAPMGGNLFSNIGRAVGGWLRQGMAKVAENLARPLKGLIRNTVGRWGDIGRLGGDTAIHVIDKAVSWVRGQDNPMAGGATHGGPPPGSGAWRRPSFGPITSRYGPRWGGFHAGIDIAGGGPTFAAADGTVYRVGTGILGGRTGIGIGISHGGGVFTYYGHNPVGGPRVRPGQKVKAGQHIGYQGATGNVTGTHLHFELHRGGWGRAVNPASLPVFDQGGAVKPGVSLIENRTGKMEYLANVTDAVNNGGASGAKVEQHFHGNHYDERQLARFAANRTRDVLRSTRF